MMEVRSVLIWQFRTVLEMLFEVLLGLVFIMEEESDGEEVITQKPRTARQVALATK